jgi:replicative DNA helicase
MSEQISAIGYKADSDITTSLGKADDMLINLRGRNTSNTLITPTQKQERLYNRYLQLNVVEGSVAVSSGLRSLDYQLGGGFYGGDLHIIAGRTGMGKSSILINLARNMARSGNIIYFSCEMGVNSLGDKEVAGDVGIPVNRLRMGKYGDDLINQIMNVVGEINQIPVYTYDEPPITTDKIIQLSNALYLRSGLSAIIVDHLGLLDDDIGENRNLTLGFMTKKLKQLAIKLDIPVLLAHQLSREVEKREDKRPVLSDLRESGRIEEDADGVLFLYRDSYYYRDATEWRRAFTKNGQCPDYPETITECIIAKQRLGEISKVKLHFDKTHQRYYDLAEAQDER